MALLPNNRVYKFDLYKTLEYVDDCYEAFIERPYMPSYRITTAIEDLQQVLYQLNIGLSSYQDYAIKTYVEEIPEDVRVVYMEAIEEYVTNLVNLFVEDVDGFPYRDIHFDIEEPFIYILDARRRIYVPSNLNITV